MTAKTINFKSRSSDNVYQTRRNKEGKITCNCKGWIYNRKCWHTTRVAELAQLINRKSKKLDFLFN